MKRRPEVGEKVAYHGVEAVRIADQANDANEKLVALQAVDGSKHYQVSWGDDFGHVQEIPKPEPPKA